MCFNVPSYGPGQRPDLRPRSALKRAAKIKGFKTKADERVENERLKVEAQKSAKPERKPTPARQRFRLLARDKFACVYCGAPGGSMRPDGSTVVLDIDHRVSIADGGDESDENKCAACERCNGGKGRKSVVKVTKVDKGPIQAQLARVKKPA